MTRSNIQQIPLLILAANQETIQVQLASHGHLVRMAKDEHDLYHQYEQVFPRLVILDDMDICARCYQTYHAPILMIAAAEAVDEALQAHAMDCLVQPYPESLLVQRVANLLHAHPLYMYDSTPIMVHALNKKREIIYVNEQWQKKTGYSREEAIGNNLKQFLSEAATDELFNSSPQQLQNYHSQFRCKNGSKLDVIINAKVITGLTGEAISLAVSRDITAQKQIELELRESEQRYRRLFESANDGIILVDVETSQIVAANDQFAKMLDYQSSQEVTSHSLRDIDVQKSQSDTAKLIPSDLQNGDNLILETVYRSKKARLVPVETSNRIIQHQDRPTLLSFVRDITERQRINRSEREQRLLAEALRDSAAAFNRSLSLNEVLDATLKYVTRVIPNRCADVMLVEDGLARIVRHQGYTRAGFDADSLEAMRFNTHEIVNFRWRLERKTPLIINDTRRPEVGWVEMPTAAWVRSLLSAPIVLHDEVIGFINLNSPETDYFSQHDAERLQAFVHQATIAIENAQLFERTQQYAAELEARVEARTEALTKVNVQLRDEVQQRKKMEAALEDERSLLKTLIDNIPDYIYIKDMAHHYLLANEALIKLLGLPNDRSLIGKTNYDIVADSQLVDMLHEEEKYLLRHEQPVINKEVTVQHPDGERRLLYSKLPLYDSEGNVIGIVGVDRDITQLKDAELQLQEERNLLRRLIDTLPDFIYIKDRESRFILANQAVLKHFKLNSIDQLVGKTVFDFHPQSLAERIIKVEQHIVQTGESLFNRPDVLVDADGQLRHLLVTKMPLRDSKGEITGLIGVNHDITELRAVEEQLEQVLNSAQCLLWSAFVEKQDGTYQWDLKIANEQAAQNFLPLHVPEGQTYAQVWQASILPDDRQTHALIHRQHIENGIETYSHEFRCQLAENVLCWLVENVQVRPINAARWHLVGVCMNISERKQFEETLQEINDMLEQLVEERTQELSQANASLKQEIAERKRAEYAERHQRIMAETLRDSVAMLNQSLERDVLLDHLLDAMLTAVPHEAAAIFLREDATHARIVRAKGHDPHIINQSIDISDWENFQAVIRTREPVIIGDTWAIAENWHKLEDAHWIRGIISVPIMIHGAVIGFLNVDSRVAHVFTDEHAQWLKAFANQAGIAIRNARMVAEIRSYASELEQRVQERTRELEVERAQLQAILNAMRSGVVFQDLDLKPQYINTALTTISGYTQAEWLSGKAQAALNTAPQETRDQLWRKIVHSFEKQGYWEGETTLHHQERGPIDVGIMRTPVLNSDKQRIGLVTVLRDISQEKALERQKMRFIAHASHELRTPIANMKTRLFLMRRKPERFMEHIEVAESVVNWMQNLVENMFDISRFERGVMALDLESVQLQPFIHKVVQFQMPEAERQQINVQLDMPAEPLIIEADPYRLAQVLTNLLSNALRYTPESGAVRVQVAAEAEQRVIIKVADDGPGIKEEDLPFLFQPFFRAADDNQGAGLGLSISQEIVKLHRGEIDVHSVYGAGTEITVVLPIQQPLKSNAAGE